MQAELDKLLNLNILAEYFVQLDLAKLGQCNGEMYLGNISFPAVGAGDAQVRDESCSVV